MSPSVSSSAAVTSGLVARESGQSIPLEHVRVEAHVVDLCARVTVHQRYRNTEDVPLEVVYVFPVDEGAAVCGFEATVDGVRYVGRAMERDEAFKEYDDALEAGHGGFLLDEERADVFTASLGNMKPGSEVVLSITYVTELAAEGAAARFTLPTTVSPRYAPASDTAGVGQTPAEALNPPVALDVPYAFTFEMDVTMNGVIRGVQSPSHPIDVEQDGTRARVRLAQRNAPMDRDLVIVVAADGLGTPHATVERGERGGAVLLSFVPRFEASTQPAEVVFVIDRSGSMGGSSIAEVRNALQLCLRSLSAGSRFNIVSFGSTFEAFFPASRAYDEASMKEAAAFVATLEANMGGTELLPALQFVVSQEMAAGLARQVLVLTDGEVTNTDEVIDLVRRHARAARFFTFGIGAGASQHLVRGIARASGGAAEFISPGERIEAKVMRQFRRVFAPALTDVKVEWGQAGATPASDHVPPVFDGEWVMLYALTDAAQAATAKLTGTLVGRAVTFEIPVDPGRAVQGDTIATLAARQRIRTLEEQSEYLESRGSRQRRARGTTRAASEIAALGVKYQLCSRETSFVAIEHRETPAEGRAELRRVPVALTSGWGGVREQSGMVPMCLGAPQPTSSARMWGHVPDSMAGPTDVCYDMAPREFDAAPAMRSRPSFMRRVRAATRDSSRPHDRLVSLQRADGSWDLSREFTQAVSMKLRDLEQALPGATGDAQIARRALATAIAIAWLERFAPAARGEWQMLAEKAQRWLAACGAAPGGAHSWRDIAERVLPVRGTSG
jgi:Ca-activated chloride channel family protein